MSSADPVGTRATHADLAKRGLAFVDAPVSGGVPRATDGTLAIMIGGDAAAIAAAKPVLAKMGTRLFDVGGPGNGHAMKALNNFVAGTAFIAVSEALLVGERFGLDPATMVDVMNVSTGKSFNTENVAKQHVVSRQFASGFALGLLAKDVGIAADLADGNRRGFSPHSPLLSAAARGARPGGRREGPHAGLHLVGKARQEGSRRVTWRARRRNVILDNNNSSGRNGMKHIGKIAALRRAAVRGPRARAGQDRRVALRALGAGVAPDASVG